MNTETTEYRRHRGAIFYDAHCPLCRTAVLLVGNLFLRRGFVWLPLQSPAAADRLELSQAELLTEMRLQLPDGRVLGGLDGWILLLRSVWWLRPLGRLLSLPGFHALGQILYRWIARNRYCFGGHCHVSHLKRHRRKIPFFDMP